MAFSIQELTRLFNAASESLKNTFLASIGVSGEPDPEWYIDVFPNFIIEPEFRGVFTVHLHDIASDEAGFEDVRNIIIRIGGAAVHTESWRTSDDARVITFEIDTTEAANLASNHASDTFLPIEIAFVNASNQLQLSRQFTIAVVDADPNAVERGLSITAEFPINANIALASEASTTPTVLTFGAIVDGVNNAGTIDRAAGNNAISLAAGVYKITLLMVVDSANSNLGEGRVIFAGYLYDSAGNRLKAREPLTGYERNFGTRLDRSAHQGIFIVNMTSAGSVGLRAKIYKQEQTAALSHATEVGGFVLVEKLGGGPRGERGLPGSGGAETLYGAGAPAASLGDIGDTYIDTDSGDVYEKTDATTWTFRVSLARDADITPLNDNVPQKWLHEFPSNPTITGNGNTTLNHTFAGADNLFGQNFDPVNLIRNDSRGSWMSKLVVTFAIRRSAADDGDVNVVVRSGGVIVRNDNLSIASTVHRYRHFIELNPIASNAVSITLTTTNFSAATVITIESAEIEIVEIPNRRSPRVVQQLSANPDPRDFVNLIVAHGANQPGLYYNFGDGFEGVYLARHPHQFINTDFGRSKGQFELPTTFANWRTLLFARATGETFAIPTEILTADITNIAGLTYTHSTRIFTWAETYAIAYAVLV